MNLKSINDFHDKRENLDAEPEFKINNDFIKSPNEKWFKEQYAKNEQPPISFEEFKKLNAVLEPGMEASISWEKPAVIPIETKFPPPKPNRFLNSEAANDITTSMSRSSVPTKTIGYFIGKQNMDLSVFSEMEIYSIAAYLLRNLNYQKLKHEQFYREIKCNPSDEDFMVFNLVPHSINDQGFFTVDGFTLLVTVARIMKDGL